jgi:hypothetical protein
MILDFCAICGKTEDLHHHHIVPVIRGGDDNETNLITLCVEHHAWIHALKPSMWNNHSALIKAGLEKARKNGSRLGRTPIDDKIKDEVIMLAETTDLTQQKIANKVGISTGKVCQILQEKGIKTSYVKKVENNLPL